VTTVSVTTTGWFYVGLLSLSAVVTAVLAVFAYRRRQEPGALGFAGMMGAETVWSGFLALALLVHDPLAHEILRNLSWLGTSVYLWLLLFALEYTGQDRFATKGVLGVLSIPWLLSVPLHATASWHDVWWSKTMTEVHGLAILEFSYGPAFLAHTIYSYVIIVLAAALIFRLIFVSDYLYADQSVLLVFGVLAPVVFNVLDVAVLEPGAVVDLTPVFFTISGLAFGYALFRRRLFDLVPATRKLGRNAAISQLETGVVIVDVRNRVVYCNEAAEDVLGCSAEEALDRELDSLEVTGIDFDAPDALAEIDRGGTVYEIRTSPIADRNDRLIGHTLVAHDVTARKRRERRLATQRDQLQTVSELNGLIRGIVQAIVSETDRAGIERSVCDRIVDGDLYHTACIGDVATWNGEADRWTVAGVASGEDAPEVERDTLDASEGGSVGPTPAASGAPVEGNPVDGAAGDGSMEAAAVTDGADDATIDPADPATNAPDASAPVDDDSRESVGDGAGSVGANLPVIPEDDHTWVVVPVVYGRTVYGAIGLATRRETVSSRERAVLGELGEAVGHAINAVSNRQLLSSDAVVRVDLESTAPADPLVAATEASGATIELAGIVASEEHSSLAYVRVAGDLDAVESTLVDVADGAVRRVREGDDGGLLEWRITGEDLLGTVVDHGAQIRAFDAADGRVDYEVEVASEDAARTLLDALEHSYDGVRLVAKRERGCPIDETASVSADAIENLTARQQEAIEAAFRAGYFDWPRESTAEEVASAMDIAPSTLHSHLRKAEGTLLGELLDRQAEDR
jgi:predicted DNA binding protein/PAS domain-containing protein